MKNRHFLIGICVTIVVLLFALILNIYYGGKLRAAKELNLRVQPTQKNEPFFVEIPYLESVDAFFQLGEDDFFLVEYKEYVGFVPKKYTCSVSKEIPKLAAVSGEINGETILRVQPDEANYPYHMQLENGKAIMFYPIAIYTDDDYYLCICDGMYGYVLCEYVQGN